MTCGISTGDKWDGDHILGFMVTRMGKITVPGRCGLGITNPGLVPESGNEAGVAWIGDVPLARASCVYFAADSRSESRVILRAKP